MGIPRHLHRGAVPEVGREQCAVEGGGHEDDPQVGSPGQEVLDGDEEEVLVAAPLVDLVDEDVGDAAEVGVGRQAAEEDARGAGGEGR